MSHKTAEKLSKIRGLRSLDSLLFTLVSGYYVETKGSKSKERPHGPS